MNFFLYIFMSVQNCVERKRKKNYFLGFLGLFVGRDHGGGSGVGHRKRGCGGHEDRGGGGCGDCAGGGGDFGDKWGSRDKWGQRGMLGSSGDFVAFVCRKLLKLHNWYGLYIEIG